MAYKSITGFDPALDSSRILNQLERLFVYMSAQVEYKTLREINADTGYPEASISANLRTMRKSRHGAHTVVTRRRGRGRDGVWESKLITTN